MTACPALTLHARMEELNVLTDHIAGPEASAGELAMIRQADLLASALRRVEPSTPEGAQIVAGALVEWLGETGRADDAAKLRTAAQGLERAPWGLLKAILGLGLEGEAKGLVRFLRLATVVR